MRNYEIWVSDGLEPFRLNARFQTVQRAACERTWYEARGYVVLVVDARVAAIAADAVHDEAREAA